MSVIGVCLLFFTPLRGSLVVTPFVLVLPACTLLRLLVLMHFLVLRPVKTADLTIVLLIDELWEDGEELRADVSSTWLFSNCRSYFRFTGSCEGFLGVDERRVLRLGLEELHWATLRFKDCSLPASLSPLLEAKPTVCTGFRSGQCQSQTRTFRSASAN